MTITPALVRLKQEDYHEFKASLDTVSRKKLVKPSNIVNQFYFLISLSTHTQIQPQERPDKMHLPAFLTLNPKKARTNFFFIQGLHDIYKVIANPQQSLKFPALRGSCSPLQHKFLLFPLIT